LSSRWPNKSILFSLLIIKKKRLKFKKMLVEKKWVKKNCQVGRQIIFLIWIFFFVDFQKMAGKLWIGRSIECVEFFRFF
jgi:hypothetical protein